MRCIKTGIKFQVPQFREDTFHGDMFWCNELGFYLIRGIAPGTSDCAPDMILSPIGDAYAIDSVSEGLKQQLLEWTDHDITLDIDGDPTVVIDDTRFFL